MLSTSTRCEPAHPPIHPDSCPYVCLGVFTPKSAHLPVSLVHALRPYPAISCLPLSQPCLLSSGKPATWDKQVRQQAELHSGPQDTFHCARLAAGAALKLVDAVLTGAVHNGVALVR